MLSSFQTQDKENVPISIDKQLINNTSSINADKVISSINERNEASLTPHKYPYSPSSLKPQNPNVVRLLSMKKSVRCLSDADILSIAVESSARKTHEKPRIIGLYNSQEVGDK